MDLLSEGKSLFNIRLFETFKSADIVEIKPHNKVGLTLFDCAFDINLYQVKSYFIFC